MTEAQRIAAIQDEYERETGSRPSRATAAALLDMHAEAEYQRREGGAYDFPEPEYEQPTRCNCAVSAIYGGDCAHTAPEAQDDYEPTPGATHYQHNDSPTDADPIRPGRYCGPHCDLYEPAEYGPAAAFERGQRIGWMDASDPADEYDAPGMTTADYFGR